MSESPEKPAVQKIPADPFMVELAIPLVEVTEKLAEALYEAALLRLRAGCTPTPEYCKSLSGPTRAAFAAAGDELRKEQAESFASAFAALVGAVTVRTSDDPDENVRAALEAK